MLNIYFKGEDNKIAKDIELVTDVELELYKGMGLYYDKYQ